MPPPPRSTLFPYTTLFRSRPGHFRLQRGPAVGTDAGAGLQQPRSEEHTSELQSLRHLVCRLLLEKKNGFRPTTPHSLAGMRIDPPTSFACSAGTRRAATAAAEPPLAPPVQRLGSHALRVGPSASD